VLIFGFSLLPRDATIARFETTSDVRLCIAVVCWIQTTRSRFRPPHNFSNFCHNPGEINLYKCPWEVDYGHTAACSGKSLSKARDALTKPRKETTSRNRATPEMFVIRLKPSTCVITISYGESTRPRLDSTGRDVASTSPVGVDW